MAAGDVLRISEDKAITSAAFDEWYDMISRGATRPDRPRSLVKQGRRGATAVLSAKFLRLRGVPPKQVAELITQNLALG